MNDIIKPLTSCGMVGWDAHNQLWLWKNEPHGGRSGTIIADVRGMICPICNHGWQITAESLGDQYYLMSRHQQAHQSCYIRYIALQDFDFWVGALVDAGFIFGPVENPSRMGEGGASIEAIPNEYWGQKDPWGAGQPWYRARLLKKMEDGYTNIAHGRILKLGSRKRVYVLEVEPGEGSFDREMAVKLFSSENVTKQISQNAIMVHAWGREKAKEYLKHFADILGVTDMRRKASEALASRR